MSVDKQRCRQFVGINVPHAVFRTQSFRGEDRILFRCSLGNAQRSRDLRMREEAAEG
jgi:hypothetical protein